MNLSIVGTKGAGKGTQARWLASEFNLVAFSSGDAFRAGVKRRSPLGIAAESYIQRGELVPDEIVNELIEEWIWTTTPAQGIIFDGFPRTTAQAAYLERAFRDMGRRFDATIHLQVADEEVIKRLNGRRVCEVCREEFHLTSAPFNGCPNQKCEGQHLRRLAEDDPASIGALVKEFRRGIEPLLQHYQQAGSLIVIDGDGSALEVHVAIVSAVASYR